MSSSSSPAHDISSTPVGGAAPDPAAGAHRLGEASTAACWCASTSTRSVPSAPETASALDESSAPTTHRLRSGSECATTPGDMVSSHRRRELFGDCALVEIIHLHDCLRGGLKALEADVTDLSRCIGRRHGGRKDRPGAQGTAAAGTDPTVLELERRVASRFKVIWSVFRSHSSAEDEFIWPALSKKTAGRIGGHRESGAAEGGGSALDVVQEEDVIVQEEYEEDHENEERMFAETDALLTQLREALVTHCNNPQAPDDDDPGVPPSTAAAAAASDRDLSLTVMARDLSARVERLSQHLHEHLEKEETKCLPLVVNHLSGSEIHELVGNIMGKRSADTIANIMTMAVQNLDEADREEMIRYMKLSMAGTFFDRWLAMSGWMATASKASSTTSSIAGDDEDGSAVADDSAKKRVATVVGTDTPDGRSAQAKRTRDDASQVPDAVHSNAPPAGRHGPEASAVVSRDRPLEPTSQAELEKLIRAVASNPALTPEQKNTTIQGLRDSVWKLNMRQRQQQLDQITVVNEAVLHAPTFLAQGGDRSLSPTSSVPRTRRVRLIPPSNYFRKARHGKVELAWRADSPTSRLPDNSAVPLFSAAELAPTYHDGAAGAVLGCPHYARACKLRHPKSGRLYTCRLCCQQQREIPTSDADEPLDRYEVTEVMCMVCNSLQPAEDRCINPDCESHGKPFARYFCRICHLYDDGSRPIFHCPYCNICKVGVGLGQDFRHCMRCNACVSLSEYADHHCIPQKLQGDCPICHESLFQSTEPLRGLRCGHVMHLTCFTNYRRGHSYTCPLCMRSMEDMSDYFSILDAAVRMQPMPPAYLSTLSNIYCQDCGTTGQVPYHFVGQKCPHCGSYNTREMGRVNNTPL